MSARETAAASLDAVANRVSGERGAALVLALLAIVLMMTLGGALIVLTITETMIAATFRDSVEVLYAGEAALDRALVDVGNTGDWSVFDPPRQIYARTPFGDVLPGIDADPRMSIDVRVGPGPVAGTLAVQARATRGRVARMFEAVVTRGDDGLRLLSWREVR
jgi:hypothetical protein